MPYSLRPRTKQVIYSDKIRIRALRIILKLEKKGVKKKSKKSRSKKNSKTVISKDTQEPQYIWEYYDNGWFPYDKEASKIVEQAYQSWVKNPGDFDVRSVKSGRFHYMVDFRQMKQQNVEHENRTIRDIRRVKNL